MKKRKDYDYFEALTRGASYICHAAEFLDEIVKTFDANTFVSHTDAMHAIEHSADELKHDMMSHLSHEFMTPIEREDLVSLAQELDNVVDALDDVMQRMHMYHITVLRPDIDQFTQIIVRSAQVLHNAIQEFAQFRKSKTINDLIVEVNRLESEGDAVYMESMRNLFSEETNPVNILIWTNIYDGLENCLDACEHVSDVIEGVIMKNS